MKANKKRIQSVCFATVCVFCLSLFTQGCGDGNDKIDPSVHKNMDYEKIGQLHNEGLDYIFEELRSSLEGGVRDVKLKSSNMYNISENAAASFVIKSGLSSESERHQLLDLAYLVTPQISVKSESAGTVSDSDIDLLENVTLTDKQKYYINKYKEVLQSLKGDLRPVLKKLQLLDNEIMTSCPPEEAFPLLACTSVGKYSLQYWSEHLYEWTALFTEDVEVIASVPRLKGTTYEVETDQDEWDWFVDTLKSMGQTDGIGAAIGGIYGAAAGGMGAIPGAIFVGCNSSAGAGIKELFKKWGIYS